METAQSRAPRRRRKSGIGFIFLLFVIAAAAVLGWYGYMNFIPNGEQADPGYASEHPIIIDGAEAAKGAIIENNEIKLPLPVLEQLLGSDKPVHYEDNSGSIIFTTANKVLHLKTDSLTATVNQKPFDLTIAAEKTEAGDVYIPVAPLQELYGLQVEYVEETGIVTVLVAGDAVQRAQANDTDGAAIRTEPTIRAPFIRKLELNEPLRIWGEEEGWLIVQSVDGNIGYMHKGDVKLTEIERVPEPAREPAFVAWKVLGSKINMTWEAVYSKNPNTSAIGPMPGVNVVSPTWFELADGKGTINGKADPAYVKWAHQKGMQVWALFSNGFEPEQTTAALATVETRFVMIQQLLSFAELYNLQGINIDFENVKTSDKQNLVQFVRELTPLLHEQGLVVSIDVTPKSSSEMWSLFLDRAALAKVVDYMMVMAYDEHWASSPKSGSVASLPWVEASLKRILEEDAVPANKLVLSMPLYTRIWSEAKGEDGAVKVSSKSVGMDKVKQIIAEKKLKPVLDEAAGQRYVEYTEDGALMRIWIEDDLSMKARVALARKYDLAGVATWQRTFQTESIWTTIDEALNKRP